MCVNILFLLLYISYRPSDLHWQKIGNSSATTKFVQCLNICTTGRYLSLHAQHGRPQCSAHVIPARKLHSFPFLPKKKVHFAWLNGCILKVNVDDGFLNLMTQDGTPKDDVKVPEGELGTQIQGGFDEGKDLLVTIVAAMGEEQVSSGIPRSGLDARL